MRLFTAALLAVVFNASVPAEAETLTEIFRQAQENDHRFAAQRANYRAGLEEKNLGRSALLPQISGEYTLSESDRTEEGFSFQIDPETEQIRGESRTDIESTTHDFSVTLRQPLFDLAAWYGYRRGALASKVAEAQFQGDQQQLIVRVAEAYFDVLRAVALFETAKAEENANRSQLDQTRKRFEVGLTAITEVHETQAAFDNAVARRLLEEGNVGIAFEALEVLTGQRANAVAPLQENFPIVKPMPTEREAWVNFATENNFALAAAGLNAEIANRVAKTEKAGHLPTVYLGARYNDIDNDNTIERFDSESQTETTSFSVTLNVPIFSGGGVSARRRQAAERFVEARENYLLAQRDTVQSARSLYLNVITDVATVKARAQAITSNRSALEATQAGYEVGTRDLVDVLVAQRALFQAQSAYSDTLYTYILNTLRLKEVAGILEEKDVTELNNWLDTTSPVTRAVITNRNTAPN